MTRTWNPDEVPPSLPGRTPPRKLTKDEAEYAMQRTGEASEKFDLREFARRSDGMAHAMNGGLWLHFHVWKGRPMAHLVSTNKVLLMEYGDFIGIPESMIQYKPLKDPETGVRREAWHWDLGGPYLPDRKLKGGA